MAGTKKHEVVIVFSGAVAVGPPLPLDRSGTLTEKGPLFAVMPDLSSRRPITFSDAAGQHVDSHTRVHLPVVFTDLTSDGRKPDDEHEGFRIWHPVRERMQVKIDDDDRPGVLTYVHDPNYGKPGSLGDPAGSLRTPIDDFAAIPDMRVVSPGRSTLRAGVLDPKATDVAAQVFVPSGTLRSGSEDARRFGTQVSIASSVRGGSPRIAVVVPQVRITVEVDDRLTIETSSLVSGTSLPPLSFMVDRNAEIWIGNLDMGDIRRTIQNLILSRGPFKAIRAAFAHLVGKLEANVEGSADESCDIDFAGFYDLTAGSGGVVLPCETGDDRGERNCYTTTVSNGSGT